MIKRSEVLFSTIIVLVMLLIGIWISGGISKLASQAAEMYNTATIISDEDQFRYGMDTSFGNALVYGDVVSDSLVTFDEIGNGYIYIEKVREEYTRHTRTVTKTDKNGNKYTETEVYYTWDYDSMEGRSVDTIFFLGVEFDYGLIELPVYTLDLSAAGVKNHRSNYIYTRSDVRYYYRVTPNNLTGTVFVTLKDKTIERPSDLYADMTPQEVIESKQKSEAVALAVFWVLWIGLIVFIVYKFVEASNYWLD